VSGVTAANVDSMNSALDALSAGQVDTKAKLQVVVDAYAKILAEANGLTTDATPGMDPVADDYAAIGAVIGLAKTNTHALRLLNDVIGPVSAVMGLSAKDVDTVAKVNALAAVVDKVMAAAAGGAAAVGAAGAAGAALTESDFYLLGFANTGAGAINKVNLSAVVNAIGSAGGQSAVDTLSELGAVVGAAATIASYADDSTASMPSLATYGALGVALGITPYLAMNSAVDALTPDKVASKSQLTAIAASYSKIMNEANGALDDADSSVNPSAADFALIGASIGLAATGASGGVDRPSFALQLLDDAIAGLSIAQVDSVSKINALALVVDKLEGLAALALGAAAPYPVSSPAALSMADLSLLGVNTALANTALEQQAIVQAVIDSADSGSGIRTILQLQAIVNAHAA
jgi:hypothetical protein